MTKWMKSGTAGILYAGEMGIRIAHVLRQQGLRVVTTTSGRTDRTVRRCEDSGLTVLDGPSDVVQQAEVLFSVVPPAAAEAVASTYCEFAHLAPPHAIYVDANSISPALARMLGSRVTGCGCDFVDASVNGLAKSLTETGTIYLSGSRARDVSELFGAAVRVHFLGDDPGRASSMKMLLSGLTKGLCALFAESALIAERQGMLDELMEQSHTVYPAIMALVDRMLPTYLEHAPRRADEMRELERSAVAVDVPPIIVSAVRRLHEEFASTFSESQLSSDRNPVKISDVSSVVQQLSLGRQLNTRVA
jgi:3-hydroxyisobutyrate dehydrogenase-like beta-hydroxyacid dehydrogenase